MIKRGNWAPDALNTSLHDRVISEAARFVCVLYYHRRLGTTVNHQFIVFFENHVYPMPLLGHTHHTPFRHARNGKIEKTAAGAKKGRYGKSKNWKSGIKNLSYSVPLSVLRPPVLSPK